MRIKIYLSPRLQPHDRYEVPVDESDTLLDRKRYEGCGSTVEVVRQAREGFIVSAALCSNIVGHRYPEDRSTTDEKRLVIIRKVIIRNA